MIKCENRERKKKQDTVGIIIFQRIMKRNVNCQFNDLVLGQNTLVKVKKKDALIRPIN